MHRGISLFAVGEEMGLAGKAEEKSKATVMEVNRELSPFSLFFPERLGSFFHLGCLSEKNY